MDKETIDSVICEILYQDGPDRHIDGHEVITDFIMALISGETDAENWVADYSIRKGGKMRFLT
jgi:hypothetical protein